MVPCVPTGMNAGVSNTPCRVVTRPRRAAVSRSSVIKSYRSGLSFMFQIRGGTIGLREAELKYSRATGLRFAVQPSDRGRYEQRSTSPKEAMWPVRQAHRFRAVGSPARRDHLYRMRQKASAKGGYQYGRS